MARFNIGSLNSIVAGFLTLVLAIGCTGQTENRQKEWSATSDDGSLFLLEKEDLRYGPHHTHHASVFGKYVEGYNRAILQAIDTVQATRPEGGGYFIGIFAEPTESPIGYPVGLLGNNMLEPPRPTSYCSGASYTAFLEAMNLVFREESSRLDSARAELFRMQEPDGGRREDHIKFWGKWNADGFGNHFALVQYSGMGTEIDPAAARPGDFMNISWKSGIGHSVIFLGWHRNEEDKMQLVYWSSQKGTDGLGDDVVDVDRIKSVKVVRLTNPEKLFTFKPNEEITKSIPGDSLPDFTALQ